MKLDRITLRQIRMPLVHFFETSFSRTYSRDIILVEVTGDGVTGWGEVTAGENPFYNEEWTGSAWLILHDYVAPRVLGQTLNSAEDVFPLTAHIRGHNMARGGLEAAVWDLEARRNCVPLWQQIGAGARREIPCGVSIGIQDSVEQLLEKIEVELAAGYQRIKMKIKPGWDVAVVRRVRERFPAIKLMVDANSAYSLADTEHLRELDEFYLMTIEQPLDHADIIDHAVLQAKLETPICLDECIRTAHHAEQAITAHACGIIILSSAVWPDSARPNGSTISPRQPTSQCGAAACWRPASGAPTTSRWPACRISYCPAMSPPASATGSRTSSNLPWRLRRKAPSRCATNPASATPSIWISFAASR